MNKKSKIKFMNTSYAKKVVKEQKMYKSIAPQRFTISRGTRLRTFPLPKYEEIGISEPIINDTDTGKKNYLIDIKKEETLNLHTRINKRRLSNE